MKANKDNYLTCECCGELAVKHHHIIFGSKWPEGKYDPDNLMPVCAKCHAEIHAKKITVPDNLWDAATIAYNKWLENTGHKIQPLSKPSDAEIKAKWHKYREKRLEKQLKERACKSQEGV